MAIYIPHSIFHLARLLYVRSETFGPTTYVILARHKWLLEDDVLMSKRVGANHM